MNLYKFISETEVEKYNGGFVITEDDHRLYTNPTEEIIRQAGYKEMVEAETLDFDPEKEYLSVTYQDGDVITQIVTVCQIPEIVEG